MCFFVEQHLENFAFIKVLLYLQGIFCKTSFFFVRTLIISPQLSLKQIMNFFGNEIIFLSFFDLYILLLTQKHQPHTLSLSLLIFAPVFHQQFSIKVLTLLFQNILRLAKVYTPLKLFIFQPPTLMYLIHAFNSWKLVQMKDNAKFSKMF